MSDWQTCAVPDSFVKNKVGRQNQIPAKDIAEVGRFPVVDQGQKFVAGYCDDESRVIDFDLPLIIFGDHTRCFKYVDFRFVLGADGTKVLLPNKKLYDPRFYYFALLALEIPSRGYNRHFTILNERSLPLPPLPEEEEGNSGGWWAGEPFRFQLFRVSAFQAFSVSGFPPPQNFYFLISTFDFSSPLRHLSFGLCLPPRRRWGMVVVGGRARNPPRHHLRFCHFRLPLTSDLRPPTSGLRFSLSAFPPLRYPSPQMATLMRTNKGDSSAKDTSTALPGQLFYSTQIPVCIWFNEKNKTRARAFGPSWWHRFGAKSVAAKTFPDFQPSL